jgi:hypothetical protein
MHRLRGALHRRARVAQHRKNAMTDTPAQAVSRLIAEDAPAQRIADFFDALDQRDRIAAVRSLGGAQQASLWRRVDGFGELSIDDIVPQATPILSPVRHYGRNSLAIFRLFEKRFYRCPEPVQLAGANFQTISPLTGPGYFVVRADPARHEVLVDYNVLPTSKPIEWPPIVSNETGVSRLIYGFMVDTLRRVSKHVTIGRAARRGKTMNNWFVLCREEAQRGPAADRSRL